MTSNLHSNLDSTELDYMYIKTLMYLSQSDLYLYALS